MRARTRRARVVAVVVVAGLVGSTLLGAIAALGGGGVSIDIPAQGPWTVGVAGDLGRVPECVRDPAVAESYMSADMPSSGGSLVLDVDADAADVERVVRCLARVIDPARIGVMTTPTPRDAA
ncbi:hypothetical protein Cfla_0082 [Cellulomonas flavigena DSM 20109]|uniref:Uncharacterized protein n=1 Tax=Cellulomonas flavigena (strain ATCC 482 / DSM 20109 / BCRC 11376 / JCM 18109 / NBRC 3775 / NCIMB 8073 / NRS 134) TaxID=446466 RepID=D5UFP3_CELFN|nr:hypothetical protein [Cellulomonas flavigena]ADG73002.1 hypothetical protein Cfla_0082 [Cellulomonas flavigena DSM 20109]